MGQFLDITFQTRYRSGDAFAKPREFYNLVLPCTKVYKRAVGFFSSTSFLEISYGILSLVQNDGKMQLITSPRLNEDDVEAIKKGYEEREKIYLNAFKREMTMPKTINEQNRLNILANLIENGILEIKIAVTKNPEVSMYHEKIGLFEDEKGNKVAISGSMNESETAISENFESFQVFCGWCDRDNERVQTCEDDFNAMWGNKQNGLDVFDFPELPKELVRAYKTSNKSRSELKNEEASLAFESLDETDSFDSKMFFKFPHTLKVRPHQRKAIEKFIEDGFQCLFAMATGTGKTLTSLFAANELSCYVPLDSILIIVPLKDLVDQWEKDVRAYFSGTVVTVRSGVDWKEKLSDIALLKLLNKDTNTERLVIITTYDSFAGNDKKILSALGKNPLIIADEVHKFGAKTYSQKLPETIQYKIGLSATPRRPYDDKGTKAIFDYFCPNEKPYEFGIREAIDAGMLCPYNYHPVLVELTFDEMETYAEITERINKLIVLISSDMAAEEEKEKLEQMLKQRHRIIERAENKFDLFSEIFLAELKKYTKYTIVFAPDGTDENGINILSKYKDYATKKAIDAHIFLTSVEYVQGTDKKMLEHFGNGQIDVVFAKQRLNEGIDIPAVRRAFFISSSTSEREFIQRRGRVLRLCEGKEEAEIFDFVVVAPKEAEVHFDKKICNQIKESELKRVLDFAKNAKNFVQLSEQLKAYI